MTSSITKMETTYEMTQSQLDAYGKRMYQKGYKVGRKWFKKSMKQEMEMWHKSEQTGLGASGEGGTEGAGGPGPKYPQTGLEPHFPSVWGKEK